MITRHDKPVARIIPEGRPSLELVRMAVASLDELRAHISARSARRPVLSDKEVRAAIAFGRR